MGERDAFGREKDEDSLAAMGWRASDAPPASAFSAGEAATPFAPSKPRPAEAATTTFSAGEAAPPFVKPKPKPAPEPERLTPAEPPPPAPTFSRPARRRGPSLARLLILVAIIVAGWIGVSKAVDAGRDAVGGIRGKIGAIGTPKPVAPTASESLLRPAPLRAALAKLPAGRLVLLRVAADRIDAQVIGGGARHVAQVRADGGTTDIKAPVAVSQPRITVDPAAPQRIARTAARRAGRSVGSVDYLVRAGDGWELFFKPDGLHFHATPSGRKVTKIG